MATFMQVLPAGFSGERYRSSDATVFSVVEGSGTLHVEDTQFAWTHRDTLVIPSWQPYRFETEQEAVLFSFSDRAVQEKLGLWREQRGD